MCGIIGYCGKEKPNKLWLKLMALFNDSRGGQGIGYSTNGKIYKSIWPNEFKDYLQKNNLEFTGKNNTIIMHARKASVGKKTIENTHPFDIDTKLIGVHNGTISNIDELYGILIEKKYNLDKNKLDAMETDSEKFLYLLSLNAKTYLEMLKSYEGSAALMWYNPKNINELFIFKGASQYKIEERPLFFMQDLNNFIYFSSMIEPFNILKIENPNLIIGEVPENELITVQNGQFINSQKLVKTIKVKSLSLVGYQKRSYYEDEEDFRQAWEDRAKSTIVNNHYSSDKKNIEIIKNKSTLSRKQKKILKKEQYFNMFSNQIQVFKDPGKDRIYIDNLKYKLAGKKMTGFFDIDLATLEAYRFSSLSELASWNIEGWVKPDYGDKYFAFYNGNLISTYWGDLIKFIDIYNDKKEFFNTSDDILACFFDQYYLSSDNLNIYSSDGELLEDEIQCNIVELSFSGDEGMVVALTCLQKEEIKKSDILILERQKLKITNKLSKEEEEKKAQEQAYSDQLSEEFNTEVDSALQIITELHTTYSPGTDLNESGILNYNKLGTAIVAFNTYEFIEEII